MAHMLASGPTFANGMTKKMLQQEWNMGVDEALKPKRKPKPFAWSPMIFTGLITPLWPSKRPSSKEIEHELSLSLGMAFL